MSKTRWGILGPGIIAHEFANDFQFVENAELIAVASRNLSRAEEFATKYNIPSAYGSYETLYQDQNIDAIYIATPHNFHLQQSLDALKQGKSVLCEKPITISPQELELLLKGAQESNAYLVEGMWTYFLPVMHKAQQWIAEGRLGEIYHVKADFGYPVPFDSNGRMYNPDLAGGSLLDMGVYVVAMAWLFLKQEPSAIRVIARNASTGVDNDVSIQFEYPNAAASLTTAFRCKLHNWAFIIGEKGYIAIPDFWRARECFFYEGEQIVEHYQDQRKGNGFEFEIDAVSKDIQQGKLQSEIMPHEYSIKLQHLMHLIKEQFNF